MTTMQKVVTREDRGACVVLTLNRPEALNTVTDGLLETLEQHLDVIEKDASRALVITGQGRAFCAGSDLNERDGDPAVRMARVHRLVERLAGFPKISVAALNGFALGGGLEIAMACTFRVAVPTAKLGLPEIKLGLIPVYGGTQLLPRLIGQSRALQMMLTGESVSAEHGERIGLVDRLVADGGDVLQEACAMALAHGQYSLPAQQAIRRAVREGADLLLGDALRLERELGQVVSSSEDAKEGIQAFVEKRKPVFKDR